MVKLGEGRPCGAVFFALRTVRMDGHTHSAFGRLEVVKTGRRHHSSEDEKAGSCWRAWPAHASYPRRRAATVSPAPSFSLVMAHCAPSNLKRNQCRALCRL